MEKILSLISEKLLSERVQSLTFVLPPEIKMEEVYPAFLEAGYVITKWLPKGIGMPYVNVSIERISIQYGAIQGCNETDKQPVDHMSIRFGEDAPMKDKKVGFFEKHLQAYPGADEPWYKTMFWNPLGRL